MLCFGVSLLPYTVTRTDLLVLNPARHTPLFSKKKIFSKNERHLHAAFRVGLKDISIGVKSVDIFKTRDLFRVDMDSLWVKRGNRVDLSVVSGLPKASVWTAAPSAARLGLTALCRGAGVLAQSWFGLGGFLFPSPSQGCFKITNRTWGEEAQFDTFEP